MTGTVDCGIYVIHFCQRICSEVEHYCKVMEVCVSRYFKQDLSDELFILKSKETRDITDVSCLAFTWSNL
jgi:hypothetical protein